MKTKIFLIALIGLTTLSGCKLNTTLGQTNGTGEVTKEDRPVTKSFDKVQGSEGLYVYLTQGDTEKITVEADSNLQEIITTEINNGELKIGVNGDIGSSKTKKVYVTYKILNSIDASSGAYVVAKSVLKAETIYLECSSAATLTAEVIAKNTFADASSGSRLIVSGKTSKLNIDASGGSFIEAKGLKTIDCKAEASSGSVVVVNVRENLKADPSSGANIKYYGEPEVSVSDNIKAKNVRKM